ncbi:MAG: di-trans,poly-cis-decaprenylcistransferase [Chromatiales bacterium]|nr:MAG: di-trans,poly-cis-decaprenylcistransferase [Chromatiales bacterium]
MSKSAAKPNGQTPRHIAIIMDGNGRWAAAHGRARHAGHRAGVKAARAVVEASIEAGVDVLTLFAFSSENWSRPTDEVNGLMRLFIEVLQREMDALHDNGIRLRFVGARDQLPTILQKRMADAEARTAGNSRLTLVVAIAYGGRWDVLQAMRRIAAKIEAGELNAGELDEGVIARHLSLAGLPAPDLLIRTGGEYRVSNFLLWDLAYTEVFFCPTLWPDFDLAQLQAALAFFARRQRRFGRTAEQLEVIAD